MTFTDDDLKRTDIERWHKSYRKTLDCWLWIGVMGSNGYGRFWAKGKLWLAHRFAFMLSGQLIPQGMVLDHICRCRGCVNPAHLRVLTSKENTLIGEGITAKRLRRGTCDKGHAYIKESTRINPKTGGRQCEICRSEGHKKYLENNADKIKATRKRRWAERAI
jgi:hypothetical protein